jgi:nucleotide-binding universal stress UspA family protein
MKIILAPTDFSALSKNAVLYAADLASSLEAKLAVFHVYQPALLFSDSPMPPVEIENTLKSVDENLRLLKEELLLRTKNRIPITTETRVGGVRSEIKTMGERLKPYAVVMGSHGPGAFERFLLGSNTTWAAKHLQWPLIVVPSGAGFKKIERIGLAWNYRQISDSNFPDKINSLVKEFNAKLFVVCILKEANDRMSDRILSAAEKLRSKLADVNPEYEFVVSADILKALRMFSEQRELDLLVVIPGKYNFPENIFHQSRSGQIALKSNLPMLSLHE